jgi:hypothetical protein
MEMLSSKSLWPMYSSHTAAGADTCPADKWKEMGYVAREYSIEWAQRAPILPVLHPSIKP